MRCSRRLADRSPIPEAAKSKARHGRLGRHGVFSFRAEGWSSERAYQNCWSWYSWRPWQKSCWTSAARQTRCAGLSCSRAEAKTKALANLAAAAVIFKPPDLRQTFPRLKRIWKTTISAILPSKTPWGIRTQFAAGRYFWSFPDKSRRLRRPSQQTNSLKSNIQHSRVKGLRV